MSEKVYPSWRYNKHGECKLVESKAEENEAVWKDTPAAFEKESKSERVQQEPAQSSSEEAPKVDPSKAENYHEHMAQWESKDEKKKSEDAPPKRAPRKKKAN